MRERTRAHQCKITLSINLYDLSHGYFILRRLSVWIRGLEYDRDLSLVVDHVEVCQNHIILKQGARPECILCKYQYNRRRILPEQGIGHRQS